jgi:hypothetical protein
MRKQGKPEDADSPYRHVCRELLETRAKLAEHAARSIETGEEGNGQLQLLGERARTYAGLEEAFRHRGWND